MSGGNRHSEGKTSQPANDPAMLMSLLVCFWSFEIFFQLLIFIKYYSSQWFKKYKGDLEMIATCT